jgi:hypothetical protein
LTEADCFKNDSHILSLEDIQIISNSARIIIISAYDGEGYVLWQTSQTKKHSHIVDLKPYLHPLLRGNGSPGIGKGAWYNETKGESLHPDLNQPSFKGPHWDYVNPTARYQETLYVNQKHDGSIET